ncbi:MAG: ABC transporter permease, partial [Spirochaetales bacterium]|nr:ABC transporter permease [Spirochaetales bacterium]
MERIRALVKKEFRQIRRTKAYFFLIFAAPFGQLIVMGSAITNEVKNIPLVTVDRDKSEASREIIARFQALPLFDYQGEVSSSAEAVRFLDEGRAKGVIIIPRDFSRDISRGHSPALQVLIDGVDGNSAGISLGYITATIARIQADWAQERLLASGGSIPGGPQVIPRLYYNPELDSTLNFVPGLIGLLLLMISTMLTAVNIVREKELGTLEQLMVTPLGGTRLILGKIIP